MSGWSFEIMRWYKECNDTYFRFILCIWTSNSSVTLGDEPTFNSTVVAVGTVTEVLTPAIGSDARGYASSVAKLSLPH